MTELGVRTIPGYVVHERLETSAVDTTFLASRVSDGYPVVLQVLTEEFSDATAATSLRTAIDRVSNVRHPVIPTVWEIGEADGQLYTISNAVEGHSLAATLTVQRRLAHDETLAICTELADALDILSTAGIAHGAINPRTVWINDRDRAPSAPYVSLRGFGSTPLRAQGVRAEPQATPPLDLLYVAPEQVDGAEPTERTDQYALACLVLHGLTGEPLFDRPTIDALFSAHRSQTPDDAHLHADVLPQRMVDGLRRALAKDPADRFATSLDFATAIGGTAHRSWSWMIEEATTREVVATGDTSSHQIDIRDDTGPPAPDTDARPDRPTARPPHSTAEARQAPADAEPVTARSLADADWLPPSATRAGPQAPVRQPPARAPGTTGTAAPELLPGSWRRWVGAGLVLVAVAATAAAIAPALLADRSAPPATDGDSRPAGAVAREIEATWRRPVADGPVTHLVAEEEELVGAAGNQVTSLDQGTGQQRWTTTVAGAVTDLMVMGPTVIVRTADEFSGLDRITGEQSWSTAVGDLPEVGAFITGRGRMFAAGPSDGGGLAIHAIDPASGEVGWSIEGPDGGGGGSGPVGVAYDGSERGGRSLYVAAGDQLASFDTTTREPRWQVDVRDPQATSLTAIGGAVLVIDGDGRLCRHNADDGGQAWTECATLQRPRAPVAFVQVRNSSVIVAGTNEVMSVDFTSGKVQWRIVSEQELQPAMTSNRAATFIAAPDGTIEALAQANGASLWESAPFGEISAMAATDTAVFVTTSDGRLTRLEAPTDEG